jgi:hypothetical protein
MPSNQVIYKVLVSKQFVAPFADSDVIATTGIGAWVTGDISANFLTSPSDIVIVGIDADPDNDHYDIEIIKSDGSIVYCQDHCRGNGPNTPTVNLNCKSAVIPSGTEIAARVSSANGGNDIGLKIKYVKVGS